MVHNYFQVYLSLDNRHGERVLSQSSHVAYTLDIKIILLAHQKSRFNSICQKAF